MHCVLLTQLVTMPVCDGNLNLLKISLLLLLCTLLSTDPLFFSKHIITFIGVQFGTLSPESIRYGSQKMCILLSMETFNVMILRKGEISVISVIHFHFYSNTA